MKFLFTLTTAASLGIAPCMANPDDLSVLDLLNLAKQALAVEDSHNAELYEEMALMKRESETSKEYDWTGYKKAKANLKDRSQKAFKANAVEFFKARSNSDEERVCYVIDFSASMKGKREDLVRKELTHSLCELPEDSKFGVLFFAGPVWQPGDVLEKVNNNKQHVVVTNQGMPVTWKGKGASKWTSDMPTAVPDWSVANEQNKKAHFSLIKDQKLVWGTDWSSPLQAALQLDPMPDVIYFMTDGTCASANQSAVKIAAIAKEKGVRINTIAMMHPKAEKPMRYLAAKTGGDFVVVTNSGKCELHKAGHVVCPNLGKHEHGDDHADDKAAKNKKKDRKDKKNPKKDKDTDKEKRNKKKKK